MTTTTSHAVPRPRRALALALEHSVDDFYQGVVPALVPLLVAARGYDLTSAGGIVLAATLLSSLAQPLFGVLADRVHLPWLRTAGLLGAAGGIGVVGTVSSYTATWCAVLVSGLGVAAFHPEAARAVHATDTGDRGMGWFAFGGLAGFAAGPPVGVALLGTLGLGATPLLTLPAAVVALATLIGARRPAGRPRAEAAARAGADTATAPGNDWRRFGWLVAVIVTRSVLYFGLSTFLVVHLATDRHVSTATAALALTAFTGLGAVSVLLSSRVTARLGRVPTLVGSYLAAVAALAGLLLAPTFGVAVVFAGVLGAALGIPVPVHTTLGQAFLPGHLGLSSAVTLGLAASTGGLAAPLLGGLADRHGVGVVLGWLVVLPAAAALLTIPLRLQATALPSNEEGVMGEDDFPDVDSPDDAGFGAVRDAYDAVSAAYTDEMRDELARKPLDRHLVEAFLDRCAAVDAAAPVLDVGCGPGWTIEHMVRRARPVVGIDLSPSMVAAALRRNPGIDVRVGSITALPCGNASFVGVISLYSIIHLGPAARATAFAEFARVLQPGGELLVAFHVGDHSVHLDEWYGRAVDLEGYFLEPSAVVDLARRSGFTVRAILRESPSRRSNWRAGVLTSSRAAVHPV